MKRLESTERSGDVQGYVKANYAFHLRLYQQSNSPVLIDMIDALCLRVSPQLYQLERENQYKVSNIHHRNIVQAIREGDEGAATQELVLDISDVYDVLVRTFFAYNPSQ